MTVYCTGTLNNNGKITMTARGAYAQGQDVYLWKNADETKGYEYVPATGASGAARVYVDNGKKDGSAGSNGKDRSTGGGGSGSTRDANANGGSATSGAGKSGTSYSGGTGGGAAANPGYENHGFTAYDATDYGGARRSWKTY